MRAEHHEVVRAVHQLAHRLRAEQHFEQPTRPPRYSWMARRVTASSASASRESADRMSPSTCGDLLTDSLELLADLDVVGDLLGQLDPRALEFLANRLLLGLSLLKRQRRGERGGGCTSSDTAARTATSQRRAPCLASTGTRAPSLAPATPERRRQRKKR